MLPEVETAGEAGGAEIGRGALDVRAVDAGGERLLFPALLDRLELDVADILRRPHQRRRNHQAGDLVARQEREVDRCPARHAGPLLVVRQDRLQHRFGRTRRGKQGDARFRVGFEGGMDLPVVVVQETGEPPELGILAQLSGIEAHRRFDGEHVPPQSGSGDVFRDDPPRARTIHRSPFFPPTRPPSPASQIVPEVHGNFARGMYLEHYGFREAPFNITPDPRFLYYSARHREALEHLLYGIRERKGFVQITGEVGAGKTTLCRAALERLGPAFRTALILNPVMSSTQLLRTVLVELGLPVPGRIDRVAYLEMLNEFLLAQVPLGQDVVLIIDEAQDLSLELLEQVRLLSNLETDRQKLLQIVLIGQPELKRMLDDARLRQLRQRITVRYHLDSLSREETELYVYYRLQVAGGNGRPTFSRWAMSRIHRYSKGVPRLINAVCDTSLLAGYVAGVDHLTGQLIGRAIRELEGKAS
ncbi:MAG: family ATPase [Acidobacteriota bacterium]|nr:family ATPase [Acidobacteriota bacterium]